MKQLFIFLLPFIHVSNAQIMKDLVKSDVKVTKGLYEYTGDENEYTVYSNYSKTKNPKDSVTFDILFDKKYLPPNRTLIKIELKDGNNAVYSRKDTIGHYKNIHYSNFPEITNAFAIRLNLTDYSKLILNDNNYTKSFKLYIFLDSNSEILYGSGSNDLKFKFMTKPEEYSE